MSTEPVKLWAEKAFGSDAADLRQVVAEALADAYTRSRDAQDVTGATRLDPFGHSLKALQFQLLAERVEEKLPGRHRLEILASYSLAVVNNFVLYPVRVTDPKGQSAKGGVVRKPVSKLRRRMFTALGPEPYQLSLSPEWEDGEPGAKDIRRLVARLGKNTRLAAISYICRFGVGIVDVHWGEAELNVRSGSLTFHDGEDLTIRPALGTSYHGPLIAAGAPSSPRSFDSGTPPKFDLEANRTHQTPAAEAESPQPLADDAGA